MAFTVQAASSVLDESLLEALDATRNALLDIRQTVQEVHTQHEQGRALVAASLSRSFISPPVALARISGE